MMTPIKQTWRPVLKGFLCLVNHVMIMYFKPSEFMLALPLILVTLGFNVLFPSSELLIGATRLKRDHPILFVN